MQNKYTMFKNVWYKLHLNSEYVLASLWSLKLTNTRDLLILRPVLVNQSPLSSHKFETCMRVGKWDRICDANFECENFSPYYSIWRTLRSLIFDHSQKLYLKKEKVFLTLLQNYIHECYFSLYDIKKFYNTLISSEPEALLTRLL